MVKFGKWIAKHRILIIIIGIILLIPSAIGFITTRVNYDILSYLPKDIETMKGQDILMEDFGKGGFSMVMIEGMSERCCGNQKEDRGSRSRCRCSMV